MDPFGTREPAQNVLLRAISGLQEVKDATDISLRSIRMVDELSADLQARASQLLDDGRSLELAETTFLLDEAATAKASVAATLYAITDVAVQGLDKRLRLCDALLRAQMRAATASEQAALGTAEPEAATSSHRTRRSGSGTPASGSRLSSDAAAASMARLVARSAADSAVGDAFEPRYCSCNQVAFGEMIECDNSSCRVGWYHCQCVGITRANAPEGQWLCPQCSSVAAAAKDQTAAPATLPPRGARGAAPAAATAAMTASAAGASKPTTGKRRR